MGQDMLDAAHRLVELFDAPHYARLAERGRDEFRRNEPFPHLVIDNFLPAEVAALLASSYPDPSGDAGTWKTHLNSNVSRKFIENVTRLPLALRLLANAVISREFLLFLEALSGIDCLIADPYFIGGGAVATGRGDFLNIHADFNWHHKLQAHRRLNALLYLTPDWQAEWGGELELWSKDMTQRVRSYLPLFNRLIVFEVGDDANHGQPKPLTVPPGIHRRVFSAFYYTTRKTDAEWDEPHFTLYKPENSPYGMGLQQQYRNRAKAETP